MWKWLSPLLISFTIAACLSPSEPTPEGLWAVSADGQTASVRAWCFLNDNEPDPPDWQLSGKPYLIKQLSWYLRNPLQNFGRT